MVMDSKPTSPSPQSVGREFVRQYYTLLNQAPLHLHRFYSSNSSFVHGGLDAINEGRDGPGGGGKVSTDPVHGQHEIHQRIMQLNFRDCKAKIRQVDAHASLGSGVVVQVSGELSNQGQPMRRFMQTFVLAPQGSKKYYVHNDIFRYQDEVFSETDSGSACVTPNMRSERGQDPVEERGHLMDTTSPNVMAENEKNAAGVITPIMMDNNNAVVMQGPKSVHGQPSNIGVGGDGITTVSINPAINSATGSNVEQHMGGDAATTIVHPAKPKGDSAVAGTTYLNGGSHHAADGSMVGPGMQSPPISPQQHQSVAADSPSLVGGISPSGVRGPVALGAHIAPPGAAHGHAAGTGPPPGHPAQGQAIRSPQGPSVKTDTPMSDSATVSPLSTESQGDGAGSPSGAAKRPTSGNQPVAAANATEDAGEEKAIGTSSSTESSSTAATTTVAESTLPAPSGVMSFAAMAAKNALKSGPAVPGVTSGGLPPAGFNKSPSGNQGPFGASGGSNQGSAAPGMKAGSGQRPSQSGDISKEGTPISTTSGSGQGHFDGTPTGGKGGFNNRPGGRGASGRPSMGGGGGERAHRFNSTSRDDGQSDTQERRRNNTTAMYPDSQQLFVGNLPHNCTESDLESLFSQFGKVAEIRINSKGIAQSKIMPSGQRVPNFGFVVFETDAAVQACLNKTPVHLPDGHRLNVETKKNNKQMRTEGSVEGGSRNSYEGGRSGAGQGTGSGNQSFSGGSGGQGGSKGGRGGQGTGGGNATGSGTESSGGMGSSGNRGSQESLPRDGGGGGRGSWGRGSRGASRGSRGGGGGGGSGGQASGGMYSGGGRGSTGSQGGQTSSQSGATGSMPRAAYAGTSGGGSRRS